MEKQYNGTRAVLYCRVASPDAEGCALEIQEQQLNDYAAKQGYQVVSCLKEQGNGLTLNREKLNIVKEMADKNLMDRLIVVNPSRIGRDCVAVVQFIRAFSEKGIAVESPYEGLLNDNPVFKPIADAFTAFMKAERKRKKAESQRAKAAVNMRFGAEAQAAE